MSAGRRTIPTTRFTELRLHADAGREAVPVLTVVNQVGFTPAANSGASLVDEIAGLWMAFELIAAAQQRRPAGHAPHLTTLIHAAARLQHGRLAEGAEPAAAA